MGEEGRRARNVRAPLNIEAPWPGLCSSGRRPNQEPMNQPLQVWSVGKANFLKISGKHGSFLTLSKEGEYDLEQNESQSST
jgi:hypothetical protein